MKTLLTGRSAVRDRVIIIETGEIVHAQGRNKHYQIAQREEWKAGPVKGEINAIINTGRTSIA